MRFRERCLERERPGIEQREKAGAGRGLLRWRPSGERREQEAQIEEHSWGWCWGCEGGKAFEVLSVSVRASIIFSALFKVCPLYKHVLIMC